MGVMAARKHNDSKDNRLSQIPAWQLVGAGVAVLLASMGFFAWLALDPPSFLGQPYLPHTAMVCIAVMFERWMHMMVAVYRVK